MYVDHIDTTSLATLANPAISTLAAQFGVADQNSDALSAEIVKQMAKHRADEIENAAAVVIDLIAAKDDFLTGQASLIVDLQNQITSVEGLMASIARAQVYGDTTRNYVPLASQLGCSINESQRSLAKIPKDWVTPVAAAASN